MENKIQTAIQITETILKDSSLTQEQYENILDIQNNLKELANQQNVGEKFKIILAELFKWSVVYIPLMKELLKIWT